MWNKDGSRLSAAACHLQPASSPHCLPPPPFPMPATGPTVGDWAQWRTEVVAGGPDLAPLGKGCQQAWPPSGFLTEK